MLVVVQEMAHLIGSSTPLLLIFTDLTTLLPLAASPVNGHSLHLALPHFLNPSPPAPLVNNPLLTGGNFALQISSLWFLPLVYQIMGGLGNTDRSLLSSVTIVYQFFLKMADKLGNLVSNLKTALTLSLLLSSLNTLSSILSLSSCLTLSIAHSTEFLL